MHVKGTEKPCFCQILFTLPPRGSFGSKNGFPPLSHANDRHAQEQVCHFFFCSKGKKGDSLVAWDFGVTLGAKDTERREERNTEIAIKARAIGMSCSTSEVQREWFKYIFRKFQGCNNGATLDPREEVAWQKFCVATAALVFFFFSFFAIAVFFFFLFSRAKWLPMSIILSPSHAGQDCLTQIRWPPRLL